MDLTDRGQIADLLQSHSLHTQKHFGQHFLTNRAILDLIVTTANIQPTDTVVEAGPGIGVLTRELAQRAARVISFEIDTTLESILNQTVGEYDNIEVHFKDFRQADLQEILRMDNILNRVQDDVDRKEGSHPVYKFVSNLPYNAGSHILDQLLKSPNPPQSITVLLQKEVAQKIVAQPPHATYLSNFFQLYGQAKIIKTVPPGAFFPPPQVDSAILHIQKRPSGQQSASQEMEADERPRASNTAPLRGAPEHERPEATHAGAFSRFLHRGFANPRKMLNKAFPIEVLQKVNVDPTARPENLTFSEWVQLFNIINN